MAPPNSNNHLDPLAPGNRWLDTLRGLAASAVVVYHLNEGWSHEHPFYGSLVKCGWLGVPVFFVISGYLIVLAAQRAPDWRHFLLRRWWRIYPPYVASVALVFAVAAFRKITTGVNDVSPLHLSAEAWLATFLAVTPITSLEGPRNWIYWSLTCEIFYYGLIAVCLWSSRRFLAGAIAGISGAMLALGCAGIVESVTLNWWMFALGAALAVGWQSAAGRALLALCALTATVQGWKHGPLGPVVAGAVWFSMIWARHASGAWLNRERVLSSVATVSYSLYLTHVPFGVYLLLHLRPPEAAHHLSLHVLSDALLYLGCLAFAWCFWKVIEAPCHRQGRKVRG